MKTPEEWIQQIRTNPPTICEIAAIQLDAYKQGMTDAAEMVKFQVIHSDFALSHPNGEQMMYDKILTARDKKEKV